MNKELLKYGDLEEHVSLKQYNTYRVDSSCRYLIKPYDQNKLIELIAYLEANNVAYFILGNGSNVILSDTEYPGVIIKLDYFNKITIDQTLVNVGAGAILNNLAMTTINNNLKGLEWATGIPGTIGGAIIGNAGAYNSCIFDFVKEVVILENSIIKKLTKDDISYEYRNTSLKGKNIIVLACTLELNNGTKEASMLLVKDRLQRRMESQPLEYPSAGSVFRNPEGMYAGKLIEDLGLKGKHVNGAYISEKHANFIINKKNATGNDIISLINQIKIAVKEEYGLELHLEQEIIKW